MDFNMEKKKILHLLIVEMIASKLDNIRDVINLYDVIGYNIRPRILLDIMDKNKCVCHKSCKCIIHKEGICDICQDLLIEYSTEQCLGVKCSECSRIVCHFCINFYPLLCDYCC